jgi:3-hydroxyisobutyrate dehydrogenase
MKIGIAGTGRMGTAIARRLLELHHQVRVWNRTADNAQEARAVGARWTPTLGELVKDSEVVISFLFDDAAVERVYLGNDGLLSGPVEGRLFIDMSTVSPGTHQRIAPEIRSRNGSFIECPVSGSIPTARSGALVGFAGGDAADFTRAQPLLSQLCRRIEHVGPLGAGVRMKLAANLLLAVFWQALGESLLLINRPAKDVARDIDLLADSNIGAAILRTRASEITAAIDGSPPGAAAFDVDTMRKDLRYMAQEANAHGSALPLANRTLECFDRASYEGGGKVDSVAYPAYWIARQTAVAKSRPRRTADAIAKEA